MLDSTTITWLIIGGLLLLGLLLNIRSFFTWLGGTWYEKKDEHAPTQEIRLAQFGPFVWGNADVKGGTLKYSGWFNGKQLKLKRRDFGRDYLTGLGFPEEVLNDLDGSEMARMIFRYNPETQRLEGEHFPQRIDITRTKPPRIGTRVYLPALPRNWSRRP